MRCDLRVNNIISILIFNWVLEERLLLSSMVFQLCPSFPDTTDIQILQAQLTRGNKTMIIQYQILISLWKEWRPNGQTVTRSIWDYHIRICFNIVTHYLGTVHRAWFVFLEEKKANTKCERKGQERHDIINQIKNWVDQYFLVR